LARSKHTAEQIIDKLRQAEVALARGVPTVGKNPPCRAEAKPCSRGHRRATLRLTMR